MVRRLVTAPHAHHGGILEAFAGRWGWRGWGCNSKSAGVSLALTGTVGRDCHVVGHVTCSFVHAALTGSRECALLCMRDLAVHS